MGCGVPDPVAGAETVVMGSLQLPWVSEASQSLPEALCMTMFLSMALGAWVPAPAWIQAPPPDSWLTLDESLGLTVSYSSVGVIPMPTSWGCCQGSVSNAVESLQSKPGCQQPALCLFIHEAFLPPPSTGVITDLPPWAVLITHMKSPAQGWHTIRWLV